jgi:hypothetical protein
MIQCISTGAWEYPQDEQSFHRASPVSSSNRRAPDAALPAKSSAGFLHLEHQTNEFEQKFQDALVSCKEESS